MHEGLPPKLDGSLPRTLMTLTRKLRLALLLSVLLCAVGCDQTSKHFARAELGPFGFVTLPGGFGELRLAENPGSFLSLGASLPEPWRLGLLTIGVGVGDRKSVV